MPPLTFAPPLQLQSLTRGLRAEDEPAGHVTSRRAHDESDADAVAVGDRDGGSEGSAGPFAGAFTCCWQDQEADQQQQQQQGVRRRRVITAARVRLRLGWMIALSWLDCRSGFVGRLMACLKMGCRNRCRNAAARKHRASCDGPGSGHAAVRRQEVCGRQAFHCHALPSTPPTHTAGPSPPTPTHRTFRPQAPFGPRRRCCVSPAASACRPGCRCAGVPAGPCQVVHCRTAAPWMAVCIRLTASSPVDCMDP